MRYIYKDNEGNIKSQYAVTDSDVLITNQEHIGENLKDIISKHDESISDLKSNMKWMAKYGRVGSGGAGGGSGSSQWGALVTFDDVSVTEKGATISLKNGAGSYTLNVRIKNAQGGVFSVSYSYEGKTVSGIVLDASNGWSLTTNINVTTNDRLAVDVTDGNTPMHYYGDYITAPYIFGDLEMVSEDGTSYGDSGEVLVDSALARGLYMSMKYTIAVEADAKYQWSFNGNDFEETVFTEKAGTLRYKIGDEFISNDMAGLYNGGITVKILPTGGKEEIIRKNVAYNLIPNTLFLKLDPEKPGEIYDSELDSNFYEYSINKAIGINAKIYKGAPQGLDGSITYTIDDAKSETMYVQDGKTTLLSFTFTDAGWHKIDFDFQLNGEKGLRLTKYLYCKEAKTVYNWYQNNLPSQLVSESYRFNNSNLLCSSGINKTNLSGTYYEMTSANDKDVVISGFPQLDTATQHYDFVAHIGIQYNKINNTKNPIIEFYRESGAAGVAEADPSIIVYQNKVVFQKFTSGEASLYLPKEDNYSPQESEYYHLVSIAQKKLFKVQGTDSYKYEVSVYLDGVLEGTLTSFATNVIRPSFINLKPSAYSINLLDISYTSNTMTDMDFNYYYNTYKIKSTNNENAVSLKEQNILNAFFDYDKTSSTYTSNVSLKHDIVKLNYTTIQTISKNSDVPSIVFVCPEKNEAVLGKGTTVFDWMNYDKYGENSDTSTSAGLQGVEYPISIRYASNSEEINFSKTISIESELGDSGKNMTFYIKLQGSSTMKNKSKNFTLGIKNNDEGSTEVPVFSPNFKKPLENAANNDAAYSTFLPEESFIMKADVVESSHSNNNTMGEFINDYCNFDYKMGDQSGAHLKYIRKCLEGYPLLVFMEVHYDAGVDETGKEYAAYQEYYYLGIYNMNLGRTSRFNLGYSTISESMWSKLKDSNNDTFTIASYSKEDVEPITKFVSAEIQGNNPLWDFSQNDMSILFDNNSGGGHMFDDLIYNSNNATNVNSSIQKFVTAITKAGAYLFREVGKEFKVVNPNKGGNTDAAYHIINTVPDYQTQYSRQNEVYTPITNSNLPSISNLSDTYVSDAIFDNDENNTKANLNYNSLLYYYTVCMIFGLVDSVQKNLTLKTWDGDTYGLFFYDMDTCLGRTNGGGFSSYFCFSDYWKTNYTKHIENGKEYVQATGCDVFRDYYPQRNASQVSTVPPGYDIPSSYLFAIVKYAKAILGSDEIQSPQDLYATWRKKGGPLETADKFIDGYYRKHLSKVSDILINLNYRCKYLFTTTGDTFNETSIAGFSGRNVERTREWMTGRLHILDAYFNLSKESITINPLKNYLEPIPAVDMLDENKDIFILHDIFSSDNTLLNRTGSCAFRVMADDYSPLIHKHATTVERFLLEDSNTEYYIKVEYNGNEISSFGGSSLWTKLDSIDPFANSRESKVSLTVKSDRLEEINGESGTDSGTFNFNIPAVKEISLHGESYSSTLKISENDLAKFYSLNKIDISNSRISLDINKANITTLNLSNVNSSKISIQNCTKLKNLSMVNAKVQELTISPIWTEGDLNFNQLGVSATKLTLAGKNAGTLTIDGSATLTQVQFSGFQNVVIKNCPNLIKIIHADNSPSPLKTATFTNNIKLNDVTMFSEGLTSLTFNGCKALNLIKFIKGSSFNSFVNFDIANTGVKAISYDNGTTILSIGGKNVLDLRPFPNSTSIALYNDVEVEAVQYKNDPNNPVYLKQPLRDNVSLTRVYGNVVVDCSSCFYNCTPFSIFGTTMADVEFSGKSILSGDRVLLPCEVINGEGNYNNVDLFQGDINSVGVTNMSFKNLNTAFYQTSFTLFDKYYAFARIVPGVELSAAYSFYGGKNPEGAFNHATGNSPNRHMFDNASGVTSLAGAFYAGAGTKPLVLYSPTHSVDSEGVETINNDGLFSKLSKCTIMNYMFWSMPTIIDRYLFRRNGSTSYAITSLDGFSARRLVADTNTFNEDVDAEDYKWFDIANIDTEGDFTDFFKNLRNLTSLEESFYNVAYIDWSKITEENKLNLPAVPSMLGCFTSSYGRGEINLANIFSNKAKVTKINQSFRVYERTKDLYCTFYLNNDTFKGFINLTQIGWLDNGNISAKNFLMSSFTSPGIDKIIGYPEEEIAEFPYSIVSNIKGLTTASGLFYKAKPKDGTTLHNVSLPGNMFANTPNLTKIDGLFCNMNVGYTLSAPSAESAVFQKCPKLTNCAFAFAQGITSDLVSDKTNIQPKLTGMIPSKFFWHGTLSTIASATITGTNTYEEKENPDGEIVVEYTNVETVTRPSYKVPITTISDMRYCFAHSGFQAYSNFTPEIEANPTYQPFKYVKSSNGEWITKSSSSIDKCKYTYMWEYDGNDSHKPAGMDSNEQYLSLDEENDNIPYTIEFCSVTSTSEQTFIAPPDLLRYCSSNANIEGLFSDCGVIGWSSQYNDGNFAINAYGIRGRICPYMLKPVSNTASIRNMFRNCRLISGYEIRHRDEQGQVTQEIEEIRIIPKTFFKYATSVTDLSYAFYAFIFPKETKFNNTFDKLKKYINVNSAFEASYYCGTSVQKVSVANVFDNNDITSCVKVFGIGIYNTTNHDFPSAQYVAFSSVFNKKYKEPTYANDNKFSYAFAGYDKNYVTHESPKTLPDNKDTKNYAYDGGMFE